MNVITQKRDRLLRICPVFRLDRNVTLIGLFHRPFMIERPVDRVARELEVQGAEGFFFVSRVFLEFLELDDKVFPLAVGRLLEFQNSLILVKAAPPETYR